MAIFRPKYLPIHIGLIYVKNPKPNISCLGPFKVGLKGGMSHTGLYPHFKAGFHSHKRTLDSGIALPLCLNTVGL
jgi:hypothetical protein